jgi:hypothetical protein
MAEKLIQELKSEKEEIERLKRGLVRQPPLLLGNPDNMANKRFIEDAQVAK